MSIYNGKILKYKSGKFYDVVTEMVPKDEYGSPEDMPITYALSKSGGYIGDSKTAYRLVHKFGIEHFENPDCKTCCVGYSPKSKKWYGWSHRAIYGFKVGSTVKKGSCAYEPSNKEEFVESIKTFWGNTGKEKFEIVENGVNVITEALSHIEAYPLKWGRGEWTATTSQEAKEMAKAFASSVS